MTNTSQEQSGPLKEPTHIKIIKHLPGVVPEPTNELFVPCVVFEPTNRYLMVPGPTDNMYQAWYPSQLIDIL